MGMFMMEGVLQGLLSWLLAGLLSFMLFRPLANALGQAMFGANLDYRYNVGAVLIWLWLLLWLSPSWPLSFRPATPPGLVCVRAWRICR
jgi:putative ABC transport system permease protein